MHENDFGGSLIFLVEHQLHFFLSIFGECRETSKLRFHFTRQVVMKRAKNREKPENLGRDVSFHHIFRLLQRLYWVSDQNLT